MGMVRFDDARRRKENEKSSRLFLQPVNIFIVPCKVDLLGSLATPPPNTQEGRAGIQFSISTLVRVEGAWTP